MDKTNFAGPPIIAHGDDLSSTSDPRWVALAAFADAFSAPLIGLAGPVDGFPSENPTALILGLQRPAYARCFSPGQNAVPVRVGPAPDFETTTLSIAGPVLTVASSGNVDVAYPVWQAGWTLAILLTRAPAHHRYGYGMHGVGDCRVDERPTPPVYPLYSDGGSFLAETLERIKLLWQRGEAPTRVALDRLLAIEGRPQIQRLISTSLQPWILTEYPTSP